MWTPLPQYWATNFSNDLNFYFATYKIALGCTMFLVLKKQKVTDISKITAILPPSELALWQKKIIASSFLVMTYKLDFTKWIKFLLYHEDMTNVWLIQPLFKERCNDVLTKLLWWQRYVLIYICRKGKMKIFWE